MKKFYLIVLGCIGVVIVSCKKDGFLGQTVTSSLTPDVVFKDSANVAYFLNNIYLNVGFSESPSRFGNGGLDVASDEAEPFNNASNTSIGFANGAIDPNLVNGDAYTTSYTNIRSVNVLLKNLPSTPLRAKTKTEMKAEARFLRAWYYAILLKHYGGVPLVGDTVYNYTDPIVAKRASYKDCVNYIVSECDAAGADLPVIQSDVLYGRASRGACMGLKMRVLLYAASPLFNDPNPGSDTPLGIASAAVKPLVGYVDYDINRWKLAEDAAKAIIDLGTFQLLVDNTTAPGYGFQFTFTKRYNNEFLFQKMESANNTLESLFFPPSRGAGGGGGFPYQEMVDAFPMKNGLPITDPASLYDATKPYANRDPRLEYTVNHDQSALITRTSLTPTPIDVYTVNGVGASIDAIYAGTRTGYYCNKMLSPVAAPNSFFFTDRCIPLISYPEVLLAYAEAANEYEGAAGTVKAYTAVEAIRQRAGLNPYKLPLGLTQAGMRTAIQNERRLELAYQGHRFWDVRRWKLGSTQTLMMTGLEVQRSSIGGPVVNYKRVDVRKHGFKPALYLWPLPQSEVAKSALTLQNPGYVN